MELDQTWHIWAPLLTVSHIVIVCSFLAWALMSKSDSTSAVAWCLIIVLLPFVGAFVFLLFGDQHVSRPLNRKRRHRMSFQRAAAAAPHIAPPEIIKEKELAQLALRFDAPPVRSGNDVQFYFEGQPAFDAMLEAIREAKHHIHLLFFIFHGDELGQMFLQELIKKAKDGVQVRVLYDAMGSRRLSSNDLRPLLRAGGKASMFLPLNILRRRLQVNMRNHRKILVVDGRIGFVGGLNIGDEYLGKNPHYGFWRDTHLRIAGPAVHDLQHIFCEDWDFAAGEHIADVDQDHRCFFPNLDAHGSQLAQVIHSGPDQDIKCIREMYFAAVLTAKKRVWISSPYCVPDRGLMDALSLAAYRGVDVRFLGQHYPDKRIPQFAARFYWRHMLKSGVKVYQYTKGMMHAKSVLVDDHWASVGTANWDNRSLFLNFEVNCLLYSPEAARELETAYLHDLQHAIRLTPEVYARRPLSGRLVENACRLLSPIL